MKSAWLGCAILLIHCGVLGCAMGPNVAIASPPPGGVGTLDTRLGVVATPRNFPKHSGPDVQDMFERASRIGELVVFKMKWSEEKYFTNAQNLTLMARNFGLTPVVQFTAIEAKKQSQTAELAIPDAVRSRAGRKAGFSNPAVSDAFVEAAKELGQLELPYLGLSADVNVLEKVDRAEYAAFVDAYERAYAAVKKVSPSTKVFVTFQWDVMRARGDASTASALVERFGASLDMLALASNPWEVFGKQGSAAVPADYFAGIARLRESGRPTLLQLSWLSRGRSGEADQLAFVQRIPGLLKGVAPDMLVWNFLHDVRILIFNVEAGLIDREGREKPSLEAFSALAGGSAATAAARSAEAPAQAPPPKPSREVASRKPATFGIYIARLDGSGVQPLITDDTHEMTHGRVSPDGRRVTFTRYHNKGKDGKATEDSGYTNTSIMLIDVDGTGLDTVIPARPGVIASNSSWAPDGKSLIFISTDNAKRAPRLMQVDLETRRITRLPTPDGLMTTDPHWEGSHIVFPVKGDGVDSIWMMNADGSGARQITHPKKPRGVKRGRFNFGDFDPKLSPDGSKVAFMRFFGGTDWRIYVTDVASGAEKSLSPEKAIEGLPEWSSDGRLLIFRHLDPKDLPATGLYTMTPEGRNRRMIPLPRGFLYKHAGFFPGEGSAKDTRIIYSAVRKAGF